MNIVFAFIVSVLLSAVPVIAADLVTDMERSAARKKSQLPRLSVDTDPSRPGIQSKLKVVPGFSFTIDVVVSGVDQAKPLDVYQFSLVFDPNVVRAVSIVSGSFFPHGFIISSGIRPSEIRWAEFVGFGQPGVSGDGILATITFEVLGNGQSKLDLRDAILAGVGEDITGRVAPGVVTVSQPRRS